MRRERPRATSKSVAAFDDRRLDDLGQTFAQRSRRQRAAARDVAKHADRIAKDAGEVFAAAKIDAGLAADRGIDHRDQRRRHVRVRNAAHVGGRSESEEIAGNAAADAEHDGRERSAPGREQRVEHALDGREALAPLARARSAKTSSAADPAGRDRRRAIARTCRLASQSTTHGARRVR